MLFLLRKYAKFRIFVHPLKQSDEPDTAGTDSDTTVKWGQRFQVKDLLYLLQDIFKYLLFRRFLFIVRSV